MSIINDIMDTIKSSIESVEEDIGNMIKSKMQSQPYRLICAECGENLDYVTSMDSYLDLIIKADPHECK